MVTHIHACFRSLTVPDVRNDTVLHTGFKLIFQSYTNKQVVTWSFSLSNVPNSERLTADFLILIAPCLPEIKKKMWNINITYPLTFHLIVLIPFTFKIILEKFQV